MIKFGYIAWLLVVSMYFFVKINQYEVNGDDIKNEIKPKEWIIKKIYNKKLVNNGRNIVKNERYFRSKEEMLGRNGHLVMVADGGYIIVTEKVIDTLPKETPAHLSRHKLMMTKVGKKGMVEWKKVYGYKGMNQTNCIEVKYDKRGGYLILGEVIEGLDSYGDHNMIVAKFDNKGELEWDRLWEIEGVKGSSISGIDIIVVNDGYVVAGSYERWVKGEVRDYNKIVKLKRDGEKIYELDFKLDESEYGVNGILYKEIDNIGIFYNGWNKCIESWNNDLFYSIVKLKSREVENVFKLYLDIKNGELFFNNVKLMDINLSNNIIFGDIFTPFAYSGIFLLNLDNEYREKWMKILWNGKNYCYFKGVLEDKEGNYIIYGNISYKLKGYGSENILIKVDRQGEIKYMQIFGIGNRWNEVRDMVINEKGELIGLFEWSNKENGKYESYISIEKITVK